MMMLPVIAAVLVATASAFAQPEPAPADAAPKPQTQPQPQPPAPAPQSQPATQSQPQDPLAAIFSKYAPRLEALSPADPDAYFLLGEEIADQAVDYPTRRLATELYVLAFELSRQKPGHTSQQAAASLALAELVKVDHDRRWLIALARTLDPRRVPPEWLARQAPETTDSAAYQVATLLGLVRSGDGLQARQLIERPEVRAALDGYDRMLSNMGVTGGASGIIREADRWPCPLCQNERVIKKGNPPEAKLCPNCEGDPGPQLSGTEFVAQLRFESLILQGSQRSWAAQIAADGGTPLMDPDAAGLAAAFDADPTLVLWRNGHWVLDPDAPPPPKPAPLPLKSTKPTKPGADAPIGPKPPSGN